MGEILTILIADDEMVLAELLKLSIEKEEKYKVIGIAKNEEEEIKMIEEYRPKLVITDLKKKDRWSGMDIIRSYKDKEEKPIFFIISGAIMGNTTEIRELNVKYYLTRPFAEERLYLKLEEIYNNVFPKALAIVKKDIIIKSREHFFIRVIKKVKDKNYYKLNIFK